ncbi:MAG: hypothetical protein AAGA90_13470 [Actinomycetota bacterium]
MILAALFGGATAFQGIVVLVSRTSGSLEETKLTLPSPTELFATLGSLHVTPIAVGRTLSADLADEVIQNRSVGSVLAVLVVGAVVAAAIAIALRGAAWRILLPLGGAFALTEILVQLGAWGVADARYAVVPLSIVSLLLAHGLATATDTISRSVAVGLVAVASVVGVAEYWTERRLALTCSECPDWQAEVDAWEADPSDGLEIWPYPPWPFAPWIIELSTEASSAPAAEGESLEHE